MAADLVTLQTRLSEAEDAYHALQTGKRIGQVWRDGRRLSFTPAPDSIKALQNYISELNAAIAVLTGEASTDPRLTRRPGRFMFL